MPSTNPLEEHRWAGEFFPKDYEKRFQGTVTASPTEGIVLDFSIVGTDQPPTAENVYGILSSGQKCTLVGKFDPQGLGIRISRGLGTRYGKQYFPLLVIGDFLSEDVRVNQIIFNLTNLQEFFYNYGSKDYIPFQRDPILTIPTSFGTILFEYGATFGAMGSRIDPHIWSESPDAVRDLQEAYVRVKEKHPKVSFMVRKDIEVQIRVTLRNPEKVDEAYKHVVHLQELFAVLSHQPVYPVSVTIGYQSESGQQTSAPAVPSLLLDENTVEQARRELLFFLRPINIKTVDLQDITTRWLSLRDGFESVISRIQAETGVRTPLTVREELVMLISQLEGIAAADGQSGKYERYQYAIDKYASPKVKNGILGICSGKTGKGIGSAISDVRNEIVHLGKPGRILGRFSLLDLIYLAQYLRAAIFGYILVLLEIKSSVSHSYQDYNTH